MLPIDVNASAWDNKLEPFQSPGFETDDEPVPGIKRMPVRDGGFALRLGLRQLDGFREEWADRIVEARGGGYASIEALARRARLPQRALRLLADADAFGSIGLARRGALWEVRRMPDAELPLFAAARAQELGAEPEMALPLMSHAEQVTIDYQMMRMSLKGHHMAFLRPLLATEGLLSCKQTSEARNGSRVRTAGIVLVRQRPGKGNAIFVTLEDETGITNVLIWARLFENFRRPVMASRLMLVEGEVQRSPENVVHLMASRIVDRTDLLDRLSDEGRVQIELGRSDEVLHPHYPRGSGMARHPRDVRILPKSRDFH